MRTIQDLVPTNVNMYRVASKKKKPNKKKKVLDVWRDKRCARKYVTIFLNSIFTNSFRNTGSECFASNLVSSGNKEEKRLETEAKSLI
jgi:hypothetical protein